jgi:hypothetical protein
MIARVRTFACAGIEAVPVKVQAQISGGAGIARGWPARQRGGRGSRADACRARCHGAAARARSLINPAAAAGEGRQPFFDRPIALGVLAAMGGSSCSRPPTCPYSSVISAACRCCPHRKPPALRKPVADGSVRREGDGDRQARGGDRRRRQPQSVDIGTSYMSLFRLRLAIRPW